MAPLCIAPWVSLIFGGSVYSCCCQYDPPQTGLPFPSTSKEVMDIFNSSSFTELREILVSGNVKNTACESCIAKSLHKPATSLKNNEENNLKKIKQSILDGEIEVGHTPIKLTLRTSTACNIRCIMCPQHELASISGSSSLSPHEEFISAIEDIGLENIDLVILSGGEPFFTKDSLAVFHSIANKPQEIQPDIFISTNGTLLHKHWDAIKKCKNLKLSFSIDAFGENYEKIRQRASWKQVLENFKTFNELRSTKPGGGFSSQIAAVVMKSSLPDMHKLIELGHQYGAPLVFQRIKGGYYNEDFYHFPEILKDTNWEKDFDLALSTAARLNSNALGQLKILRKDLQKRIDGNSSIGLEQVSAGIVDHQIETIASLQERRIAFLGSSDLLVAFLSSVGESFDKKIVVSMFDIQNDDASYLGRPVVKMDQVRQFADVFIVSSRTYQYEKYVEWAERVAPKTKIIPLPQWEKFIYNKMEKLSQLIGQRPIVCFATGGVSKIILDSTPIGNMNIVAFSDNNKRKWGKVFSNVPIVPPQNIPDYAKDVVVLSDLYSKSIEEGLRALHGKEINVHAIF